VKKWNKAGKRQAATYLYRVDVSHSRFMLDFLTPTGLTQDIVGYHGTLELDRETGNVLSMSYIADAIPKTCPVSSSTTAVTYDFADVGGKQYLLPASSETEMRSRQVVDAEPRGCIAITGSSQPIPRCGLATAGNRTARLAGPQKTMVCPTEITAGFARSRPWRRRALAPRSPCSCRLGTSSRARREPSPVSRTLPAARS